MNANIFRTFAQILLATQKTAKGKLNNEELIELATSICGFSICEDKPKEPAQPGPWEHLLLDSRMAQTYGQNGLLPVASAPLDSWGGPRVGFRYGIGRGSAGQRIYRMRSEPRIDPKTTLRTWKLMIEYHDSRRDLPAEIRED